MPRRVFGQPRWTRPLLLAFTLFLLVVFVAQHCLRGGLEPSARAASTFVVTNTNNSGAGSLRQAMTDANNTPGLDTITFSIGSGVQTIKPQTSLPVLTDPVVIDGTTQPGFAGTPIVELDFSEPSGTELTVAGGDSTIRGLVINRCSSRCISLAPKGGNRIEGCYIGTNVAGTAALSNISDGIHVSSSNNVIGGTNHAARNVVSGNNGAGITVSRACCTGNDTPIVGNLIQGNFIGTNATGTAALPNTRHGVTINSFNSGITVSGNIVGGTAAGAGNVISGNRFDGVAIEGAQANGNVVQGNLIGTNAAGDVAVGNGNNGVRAESRDNIIGGAAAGARNVISGNGYGNGTGGGNGVSLGAANVLQGNIIGANAAGTAPLPNLFHGVGVGSCATIGGTAAGEGNLIAFNGFDGVSVGDTSATCGATTGTSIRHNSIFSNRGIDDPDYLSIGIDLGGNDITLNDPNDVDTGANGLQNFPVITSVATSGASTTIQGTLNSTPATSFNLDFYANSMCHPLGYGEGARIFGSASVATDASGNAAFNVTIPAALVAGQQITSTATDPSGRTSEFSQCDRNAPATGSVNFITSVYEVAEGDGVATITVSRAGGSTGALAVNYSTRPGTAAAGSDFTATQGTVNFNDGEITKTFNIPILEDVLDESAEIVNLTLGSSGNLDTIGAQSTSTLQIVDNDLRPLLSVNDTAVTEGDSGTLNAVFTLSLSVPSGRNVVVDFDTFGATATPTEDFTSVSERLTIPPGTTSITASVPVVGDTLVEPDETFFVNLSSPNGADISDERGIGLIRDNDGGSSAATVQFSAAEIEASEGPPSRVMATVVRSGDVSTPATVDYATSMPPDSNAASERTDYNIALGTLRFAAGEFSKSFVVFINDDVFPDGVERVTLTLSNPTGGVSLGAPSVSTILIFSDDPSELEPNPIDDANFFVRQHYRDFLNRDPDAGGLAFWSNQITECQQPNATCDAEIRRINVSAAFFLSIEFQQTGYLVYRTYEASFGNISAAPVPLTLREFLFDTQEVGRDVVIGQPGSDTLLEQRKVDYFNAFVQRARFTAQYPSSLAPGQYVDALNQNTGNSLTPAERDALVAELSANNSPQGRAVALRKVAENAEFTRREFNRAFVLMQYFGYLQRNPPDAPEPTLDYQGYNFWLGKLNQSGGNFVDAEMVKAFITSGEYRNRFGQ